MQAHRASLLHFLEDPDRVPEEQSYQYFEDGLLLVDQGLVVEIGASEQLLSGLPPHCELFEHPGALIMPGMVDTHVHYPQTEIIAARGKGLLEWLEAYTYPVESRFSDADHARAIAELFLDELLRCGTTTAMVFGTSHRQSVDAFFEACEARNLRMIAGKVLMDRNAPDDITDTAESGYHDSKALIEKWHNRGRLRYAVTPRFAATSASDATCLVALPPVGAAK